MHVVISFVWDLSLENSQDSYLFSEWFYLIQCLTTLSSINYLLWLIDWVHDFWCYFILNIVEILSNKPSVNIFVCGLRHHKVQLTYSCGIYRPGKIYRPVIIFPTQVILLTWLTFLLGSLTVTLWLLSAQSHSLDFFHSSDASSTVAFPPMENFGHIISIVFSSLCCCHSL